MVTLQPSDGIMAAAVGDQINDLSFPHDDDNDDDDDGHDILLNLSFLLPGVEDLRCASTPPTCVTASFNVPSKMTRFCVNRLVPRTVSVRVSPGSVLQRPNNHSI